MKKYFSLLIPLPLLLFNIQTLKSNGISENNLQSKTCSVQSSNILKFTDLKLKYDTLLPIFDGLFITCFKIDSDHYIKLASKKANNPYETIFSGESITSDTKKWGVIDSAGKIIVPFICDGVKVLSENRGIISVFSTSYSLNTGIPRYMYIGTYYYFTKTGIQYETSQEFQIKVEYIGDWHHPSFVIRKGPEFYLPDGYRTTKH